MKKAALTKGSLEPSDSLKRNNLFAKSEYVPDKPPLPPITSSLVILQDFGEFRLVSLSDSNRLNVPVFEAK